MLKLRIDSADAEVTSPSVPVRWCLDKSVLDELNLGEKEALYVFLAVRPVSDESGNRETTTLVLANQLEHYLAFQRPGEYVIAALLLRGVPTKIYPNTTSAAMRTARETLVEAYRNHTIFEYSREAGKVVVYRAFGYPFTPYPIAVLEVNVPQECFASEPAAWEKSWVNLLFDEAPYDQCAFRRRRIFAYTLQPLYLLLKLTLGMPCRWLATLVSLVLGWWTVQLKPSTSPFGAGFMDIWAYTFFGDNVYVQGIAWLSRQVAAGWKRLWGELPAPTWREVLEKERLQEEAERRRRLAPYRNIGCDFDSAPAVNLVPLSSKVYLLYSGLKKKICKLYAK